MKEIDEREMIDRVRRIETRLMTLGDKLGFNLKEEDGIRAVRESATVYIDSMDVSVSAVVRAARREGLHGHKIAVAFDGKVVITGFQV